MMGYRLGAALLSLAVGLGACGGAASEEESMFVAMMQGLCGAEAQARAGDAPAAAVTFENRSHDGLHRLADEAQGGDRATASELLRAKQLVEAAIVEGAAGADLEPLLADLTDAAVAAAASIDVEVPGCEG